jgi:long-chain fatty acid transport protein
MGLDFRMRPASLLPPAFALALLVLPAGSARASGPLVFQHGGRPAAEAGAFVARATDAGAVDYNPAAIARLQGAHYQLGFDYTAPIDEYKSATGSFKQDKLITDSPALYATWHLPEGYYPLAYGIGIDHRTWYLADWKPKLFPGRFLATRQKVELWSIHPVVAYQLGDRWSIGGGLRYYKGDLEEGRNKVLRFELQSNVDGALRRYDLEVERESTADADGYAVDLGLHYGAKSWGWGLVLDSGGKVKGNGDATYVARDVPNDPQLQSNLQRQLARAGSRQSFELPREVRTGLWLAASPAVRVELDLAWTAWSVVDETSVTFDNNAFGGFSLESSPPVAGAGGEVRSRQWNDTLSVRLGTEWDVAEHWGVNLGAGLEPSPVPSATVEPGFARGDALVLGAGMTYRIRGISFDLGYSYFQYDGRRVGGQELQHPQVSSTYESSDQVFGFSVSWGG